MYEGGCKTMKGSTTTSPLGTDTTETRGIA
jgi:hypothetical protein